jgi:hypothetical protein
MVSLMKRLSSVLLAAVLAAPAGAQANPPGTDIYLAALSVKKGTVSVGVPSNVTGRAGYDNQPSFTPDGKSILFTSTRDDGQSDIYRYHIRDKHTARVTVTPESEYSATLMPGGKRFSVIRVERDSTQRLWSFNLDGTNPTVLLQTLKPVGYHAWADGNTLALFVLGNPNALVRANNKTGRLDTLSRNIGRSLATVPGKRGFSYVQRLPDSSWALMTVAGKTSQQLAVMPAGADFIAWLGPDVALTATGSKLLTCTGGCGKNWTEVADLAGAGLTRLSRLAVSPDGKWLALVAEDR